MNQRELRPSNQKSPDIFIDDPDAVEQTITTAVISLVETFEEGAEKGKTSFYDFNPKQHVERALKHLSLYMGDDTSEPHLAHALWRTTVAKLKDTIQTKVYSAAIVCPMCGLNADIVNTKRGSVKYACPACNARITAYIPKYVQG